MAALFRRRRTALSWSVVVAAPKGPGGAQWGDTWFATDLVEALNRAGQQAKVVFRQDATKPERDDDDVVLVLRGLRRIVPRRSKGLWLLWVISHPELVESDEPGEYDAVFAASANWPRATSDEFGVPVTPLLQATNPRRFTPTAAVPDSGDDVLFVGSTRGEFRPIVRDALAAGVPLTVYGVGWQEYLAPEQIRAEFLSNDQLPAAYASAGIVLNDHWPDMAADGFLSNRLFDATASAARVVSDPATGLTDVFGDVIRVYRDPGELDMLLTGDRDAVFPDRQARVDAAARIAREHSFDARAQVLIERVGELRSAR